MPRSLLIGAVVAALLASAAWRAHQLLHPPEPPFEAKNKPAEAPPLCPWREPENDLKTFFPGATRFELQTRVLSALRVELKQRLGRFPASDEGALVVHRVYHEQTPLGSVLTRRVKGEHGAIELVLAAETDGRTRALKLQRLREPEPIADALQNAAWLGAFAGRDAKQLSQPEALLQPLPAEARASASAVIDGVRSLLILLAAAEEARSDEQRSHQHH